MKKTIFAAAVILLLSSLSTHANIFPKKMRLFYVEGVLTNLGDFPEYIFVHLERLGDEIKYQEIILPEGRFSQVDKINRLDIVAIPVDIFGDIEYLDDIIDLIGPQWIEEPWIYKTEEQISATGRQLKPAFSNILDKEIHYRISIKDKIISLEKTGEKVSRDYYKSEPLGLFLYSYILTFIVELTLFLMLKKHLFHIKLTRVDRDVRAVLIAQVITLSLLWWMITSYSLMFIPIILGSEVFAVLAEAVVYRFLAKLSWFQAFITAFICNTTSFVLCLLI